MPWSTNTKYVEITVLAKLFYATNWLYKSTHRVFKLLLKKCQDKDATDANVTDEDATDEDATGKDTTAIGD